MNDYDIIIQTIHRDLDHISKYAKAIMETKDFMDDLDSFAKYGDFCGFDYWNAYGENVDLNFCANVFEIGRAHV